MEGTNQYYQVLGLKPGASKEEVAQAYKVLTKTWYPQRNNEDKSLQEIAREKLKEIEEAYVRLMTPVHTPLNQENPPSPSKLEVGSEPTGAKVYVDGREVGETPVILSEIDSGQHTIRVFKEGFNPSEGEVEITPGERKALNARLKKVQLHGSLVVQTKPRRVMVHLDSKPIGISPCEVGNLLPGSHKLEIIERGCETWGQTITIEPDKRLNIDIDLKALELRTGEFSNDSYLFFKDSYLGMEFRFVNGGIFEMGDIFGDGKQNERPVHQVHVDDFWMGKFLVTQEQYKRLMGDFPMVNKKGIHYPVEGMTWYNSVDFINKLNEKTGMKYRLPTEAEWEYAARSGGKKEKWAGTNLESEIDRYAWCQFNSDAKTQPVGRKKPNGLGLYDMSGNLWEWVQDSYDKRYYERTPQNNPQCSDNGDEKVIRGGSSESPIESLRTTSRNSSVPLVVRGIGFRLVLPAKDALAVVTEIHSPKREDIVQSSTEPLVLDLDGINPEPKRYISPRPTEYKDEGRVGYQPVKPPTSHKDAGRVDRQPVKSLEGGLGVGAKIGLTITVVLIGGIIFNMLPGVGRGILSGIEVYILYRIWSRR